MYDTKRVQTSTASKVETVWQCTVCRQWIPWYPPTDDDSPTGRCEPCDIAVCDAYQAGFNAGSAR